MCIRDSPGGVGRPFIHVTRFTMWRSCGGRVAVVWRSCGGRVVVVWRPFGGYSVRSTTSPPQPSEMSTQYGGKAKGKTRCAQRHLLVSALPRVRLSLVRCRANMEARPREDKMCSMSMNFLVASTKFHRQWMSKIMHHLLNLHPPAPPYIILS